MGTKTQEHAQRKIAFSGANLKKNSIDKIRLQPSKGLEHFDDAVETTVDPEVSTGAG